MSRPAVRPHFIVVVLAVAVVALLAVSLGIRSAESIQDSWLPAKSAPPPLAPPFPESLEPPSAATVPEPAALSSTTLEAPCWACPESRDWPLRFKTDLDRIAPLGDGRSNAAVWFAEFASGRSRWDEGKKDAMERRFLHSPGQRVLPSDDPLLLEAEPWVDQAEMRFYPEQFAMDGWETPIPNLLLALTFAKSWIARGHDTEDYDQALADYRRSVRLGRLLRQEDVTIITDLVGLACIRIGTQAIYDRARAHGDISTALTASVILSEVAPQRLLTSERIQDEPTQYARKAWFGRWIVEMPDEVLIRVKTRAVGDPDRRFRLEAILGLSLVHVHGAAVEKEPVGAVLLDLAGDADPLVAAMARWALAKSPDDLELVLPE